MRVSRGKEEGERERDDGQNFNHFLLEKKLFLTYKKDKRVNIKETSRTIKVKITKFRR